MNAEGPSHRLAIAMLSLAGILFCTGCAKDSADDPSTPWPVGTWVRVFPADGAPDTLELRADQSIRGSTGGLQVLDYAYTKWKLGDPGMPGGLCMGEGDTPDGKFHYWSCTGYRLQGDTLWLANGKRTVFLRVPKDGRIIDVTPWSDSHGGATAPVAGDSVAPPPEAFKPSNG